MLLAFVPSLGVLAIALLVPQAAVLTISLRLVRRLGGHSSIASAPLELGRSAFARDVFPIGAAIVLSALYFRIDLFLVEYWRGLEAVAQYNAVFRLIDALRLFPAAVVGVLLPRVLGRPDREFAWKLAVRLTIVGAAAAVIGYISAPWLVHLAYGERYAPATPVLRVLFLAFPLLCLNYGLTHQAIGWGRQGAYASICAAALVLNVGVNAWLIPVLGTVGAAWTTVATETFLTVALVSVLSTTRRLEASSPAASATAPVPDTAAPAPVRGRHP
jgi:O-antigen/teichoic acid export membrane protein